MDAHTLELLEFHKIRELVAGYVYCSLGKEIALIAEPSVNAESIRAELELVSEMVDVLGNGQSPPFAGLKDVRMLARRAAIGAMLSTEQLLDIAGALTCTGHMYRWRMRLHDRHQRLIALLQPIEDLGQVAKSIAGRIDSRGHILDSASPELAQVRQKIIETDEKVQNRIKHLLRDPEIRKILRYPNATIDGDRYVLPVSVNFRHKLAGVVHRTSSTGETIYIEPAEIAYLGAERVILKGLEDREEKKILRALTAEVGRVARPLGIGIETIAKLDYVTAKAKYARDFNLVCPGMNTDGQLWLREAKHPLLMKLFRDEPWESGVRSQESGIRNQESGDEPGEVRSVVPIDVRLGQPFNMLVITGPNTGGKTVTLKTVGLLSLMAQAGMHIPAGQGSNLPVFNHVLADIGDEQSLEQSLSTFSAHISRIAFILKTADAKSLVLLDEVGAGTDPVEGAALGRAILDELDILSCRAMVTTHLGDLKTYAFHNERAENAAVEFNIETLRPTYRLHIGQFGMSNALKIARRLNLPHELLKRAYEYLDKGQRHAPEMQQLQKQREEAEKARNEALEAQHDAHKQRDEYVARVAEIERMQREAEAILQWRSSLTPGAIVWVPKYDKHGKIVRNDTKRSSAIVSLGIGQWEVAFAEIFPEKKPEDTQSFTTEAQRPEAQRRKEQVE
ncbi:MAG: DNA strand exchange inhibitor protein [Gemmataceae bacterium]|nr:DNA strand exchange inhibitor protein [Gemmataceae bacterium]